MTTKRGAPDLPVAWKKFARRYADNLAYWYQPKGLAVTAEAVTARLRVLKEFEATRPWGECQAEYVARLNEEGISEAEGKPLARMLKQVMAVLGLAWVDPADRVEMTKAGDLLLCSTDPAGVLARQSLRYQFWNPAISSRTHQSIKLHPVPFLARLMSALDGTVTANEYNLFVAKAREMHHVDEVAEQIDRFRQLEPDVQSTVIDLCGRYAIGGPKRGSIIQTIRLNRPYAWKMYMLSGLFKAEKSVLRLRNGAIRGPVRSFLDEYASHGAYIDFSTEKNFLAWMGDPALPPTNAVALDVYTAQGDIASAAKIKTKLGANTTEVKQFTKMMMSERTLEDSISNDFAAFSRGIGHELEFIGRQFPTTVGPIDILAKDRSSGGYVVLELKKGRSADKVFGQLSRYMGWVRKYLAKGEQVSGIIVGSRIDDKLRAARDAHDTRVTLVEYESSVSVKAV